jgi:anti-sigma-K factor RskA
MKTIGEQDMRAQELAAGWVLGDLSEAELLEVNSYDSSDFKKMVERTEEAASRAWLTFQEFQPSEAMPAALSERIRATSRGFLLQPSIVGDVVHPSVTLATQGRLVSVRESLAWLCAAAAIALTLCVVLPSNSKQIMTDSQQRETLIATADDLTRVRWSSTDPAKADGKDLGEVVWSNRQQKGFMTIRGLPKNDPSKEQYQLWIIDPSRDDEPIDGGVFDISADAESVIPINAKLEVGNPKVFAVTVEKPGGVVVSDQKRLPLIAKVDI